MSLSADLPQSSREEPATMNPLSSTDASNDPASIHVDQHRPLAHPLAVEPPRQHVEQEQQIAVNPDTNRAAGALRLGLTGLSPLDKVTGALNANAKYQDVLTSLLQALKVRDEQIRTLKRRVADQRVQVPDQEFVDQWWARVDGDLSAATNAAAPTATMPAFQPWPARVGIQYSFFADEIGTAPPPHPDEVERAARTPLFADPAKWKDDERDTLRQAVTNYCSYYLLREGLIDLAEAAHPDPAGFAAQVPDDAIDWHHISAAYFKGSKSAGDCRVQWSSWDDARLNRTPVSEDEVLDLVDKAESGQFDNWFQVAEALTSARSAAWAFRYYHEFLRAQGSYNERIGRKFTPAEDDLLHQAVHIHGPDQWTSVADLLGTRDAKQCLQRWKAQDPAIRRGRFTRDEDAALRAAVTQCGEKWSDVARLVLGRTDMQCRERYYNSIKGRMEEGTVPTGEWTAEEDAKLLELVAKEGTKWSTVAEQMPGRTDGMVRLRYAKLRTEIEMGYREPPVGVEELPVDVRSQRVLGADPLDEIPASGPLAPNHASMAALIKLLHVLEYPNSAEQVNGPAPPTPALGPPNASAMATNSSPPAGTSVPDAQQAILVATFSNSPRPPPPLQLVQAMQRQFLLPMMTGTVAARPLGWTDPEAEERKRAALEECRFALEHGVLPEAELNRVGMLSRSGLKK
ncbi:Myb-like DNA-binding domain protein [Allomyces arbusculus]|nr:Myb-like DNA-binding domain protein [Allomyces arbusculus]